MQIIENEITKAERLIKVFNQNQKQYYAKRGIGHNMPISTNPQVILIKDK